MSNRGWLSSLFIFILIAGTVPAAFAGDEFCGNWAQYMWDFQKQNDATQDSTWSELNAMSSQLHKGRRIAAVGAVSKSDAAAYPAIPSVVESELDATTQQKVRGLYDKYVLLNRRIEDMWKDKFKNTASPTSMQRFVVERDQLIDEMNKVAAAAKLEFARYGTRVKDCFYDYEKVARVEVQGLNQALVSANSALKVNEEVWAHAYPGEEAPAMAPGAVPVEPQISGRMPASAGEPAIVPDPDAVPGATAKKKH
jgi:hypothetical protein